MKSASIRRLLAAFSLLALLMAAVPAAGAGEAKDVAAKCVIRLSVNKNARTDLLARSLARYWDGGADGEMTVTLPRDEKAQGVMLALYDSVTEIVIDSLDADAPEEIARYTLPYMNDYIPFSRPAHSFRIRNGDSGRALRIGRINVLTEGTLPDWVQQWSPPLEGADIQLIACHPDDEVLWFGGLLPTYAGELGKKVQVTFVHTTTPRLDRKNELLDALWHCGVRNYPQLPESPWTQDVPRYILRAIRKARAQVVVTQDVKGEYGSASHIAMVAAVIDAVTGQSADPSADSNSAQAYGTWQPKKLYVHLWPENQSVFDWSRKLPRMGNRSGYKIACEAFKLHMSQQTGKYEVAMYGARDCRRLGLYFTLVGPDDPDHPDLLQHIE